MQRDVVLRWIEQIVQTVRRMLLGPAALDSGEIEEYIDEAIVQLLGPLALLVPRLDVPSAAALLSDSERILGLATLLELKADVRARGEHPAEATALRERAAAFAAIARASDAT